MERERDSRGRSGLAEADLDFERPFLSSMGSSWLERSWDLERERDFPLSCDPERDLSSREPCERERDPLSRERERDRDRDLERERDLVCLRLRGDLEWERDLDLERLLQTEKKKTGTVNGVQCWDAYGCAGLPPFLWDQSQPASMEFIPIILPYGILQVITSGELNNPKRTPAPH